MTDMKEAQNLEDDERRRKELLLAFLACEEPVWRDEDHPDLVAVGTYAWVRALRDESNSVSE
jgi:hypothetical protein